MQRLNESSGDLAKDLPRVLLENYMLLSAAVENQNLGRLQDMLRYQQKVHHNLLEIVQHIADAPAVAMTTSQQPAAQLGAQQLNEHSQQDFEQPDDPYMQEQGEAIPPAAVTNSTGAPDGVPEEDLVPQHLAASHLQEFERGAPHQPHQQQQLQQQRNSHQHHHQQQLQQQGPPSLRHQQQQLQEQGLAHQHQQQQLQQPGHLQLYQQQQQQQQLQEQGPPHQYQHHHQQQLQQHEAPPPQQQAVPFWLPNVNQPVGQLLQQLGLTQFGSLLERQHVDLAALQLMDESHMRELGLPLGAVVKIKAALSSHQQAQQQ